MKGRGVVARVGAPVAAIVGLLGFMLGFTLVLASPAVSYTCTTNPCHCPADCQPPPPPLGCVTNCQPVTCPTGNCQPPLNPPGNPTGLQVVGSNLPGVTPVVPPAGSTLLGHTVRKSAGALAFTGADVLGLGVIAGGLMGLGVIARRLGRRLA